MILTIDIGNTNIVVGGISKDKTHFIERISTVRIGICHRYQAASGYL